MDLGRCRQTAVDDMRIREPHGDPSADPDLAVDLQYPALQLDQGLHDGQPKPGAAFLDQSVRGDLREGHEDQLHILRRDADAGIGNGNGNMNAAINAVAGLLGNLHPHLTPRWGNFNCIGQQVQQDLPCCAKVGADRRQARLN